jgi:hypothetical protein
LRAESCQWADFRGISGTFQPQNTLSTGVEAILKQYSTPTSYGQNIPEIATGCGSKEKIEKLHGSRLSIRRLKPMVGAVLGAEDRKAAVNKL